MIHVNIEFSDLYRLSKDIERDVYERRERYERRIQSLLHLLFGYLYMLTPVDTGYMRSRWENQGVRKGMSNTGRVVRGLITNDTYYLPFVNEGHRTRNGGFVNGQFFIEKAVAMLHHHILYRSGW